MAKTPTIKAAKGQSELQVQQDKEQKKQAKREAKLELKIELIQKNLEKAESKAAKAKANADALRAELRELNEQQGHNHASSNHQEVEPDMTEVVQTVANTGTAPGDKPYADKEAIEELHRASLPPTEGRNDINSNTNSSPADTIAEPTQEFAEQAPSSEQHETSPVSDAKEK
jgi:hypothetical protein